MESMVLCSVCERHFFAHEAACPFCGVSCAQGSSEAGRAAQVGANSGISRAKTYAAGIALATGVVAGCGGSDVPVAMPPPDATVNLPSGGGGKVLMVAGPADGQLADSSGEDEETRRRRLEQERRRQQEEEIRLQQLKERDAWERRNTHSCVTDAQGRTVCPPYGCVFPDDACDVLRV